MNEDIIDQCMVKALDDGAFPGAVLRVSCKNKLMFEKAYGVTDFQNGKPVDTATVFDLASLTKPLATAPAFMILVQQGRLSLESTLGELVESFEGNEKKDVTVGQLLCHMSGLAAYKPYYEKLAALREEKRDGVLKTLLLEEPLIHAPGTSVVYSDIGYMILNWIIEVCSGMAINDYVHQNIYNPLKLSDLYYIGKNEKAQPDRTYAATERCPWRKKTLVGEVHDDNAWVMGGCCAHAGLFGTASAVGDLLDEFMAVYHGEGESGVFQRPVLRWFLTEWKGSKRTPGFDMPSAEGSSSGSCFSETSVGHLGFTGTSFWMDLQRKITVVLMTNRVHPSRDNLMIRSFRPLIHDVVMNQLSQNGCLLS
ncbi:MAG: serine hydrolase domain-containing protein [Desulfobacteraceae bacterium]|jgi:CubicO group peptidase (beta-lactamase class C family)